MSGYERTSTPDLIAFGRVVGTPLTRALADRLADYERIVAGLRAMEGARYGGRLVCRIHATTIGGDLHNDQLCPWWLAQQTGGGQ